MDTWRKPNLSFYAISLLFVVPYLFFFRKSVFPTPALPRLTPAALLRPFLTVLVVVHSLHALKALLSPPGNLFVELGLPLTAPVSAIRVAVLESQRARFPVGFVNRIAPDVEVLLSRLTSFEARVVYVKYGPRPLSHCTPCVHLSDFAFFALAPSVLPYLRAIILASLVTSRATSRAAWRTPCLVVLVVTLVTEAWWTLDGAVQFRDGKVDGWTHTHTYIARHTILLLVPLLVHHFPENTAPSPLPPFFTHDVPGRAMFPHQAADFRLLMNGGGGGAVPQTPPPVARFMGGSTFAQAGAALSGAGAVQPGRPSTPVTALAGTISSLSATLSTLRVLEWARVAGLRRGSLREKMSSYYATESSEAAYARSDDTLLREAERLGMGYGKKRARQKFGGRSSTWKGNGDPRGLDRDSVLDNEEEEDVHSRQHEQGEEEAELPLRAWASKVAREFTQKFFREGWPGT